MAKNTKRKRSGDEFEEKEVPTAQASGDHAKKAKNRILTLREAPSE